MKINMKLIIYSILMLINLTLSPPIRAELVEHKNLRFPIKIENLMKGDVHYASDLMWPKDLAGKYPELYDMDTMRFMHQRGIVVLVGKSVQVVNKPAGFFDHHNLTDEKFIKHILGDQTVKKMEPGSFKVTIPGQKGESYKLKTSFDSDDISTLPNSRVIRAVTQAKKLDVISQSSTSTFVEEMYDFSSKAVGGVSVSSFVPLKEEKTLMLTYTVIGLKLPVKSKKHTKKKLAQESLAMKELIESFK